MKRLHRLVFVCSFLAAASVASCGGTPEASDEVVTAPVATSDIYVNAYPGEEMIGTYYGCAGLGYNLRQTVFQSWKTLFGSIQRLHVELVYSSSIDYTRNEIQFQCPRKPMGDTGTFMRTSLASPSTCQVYSHTVGFGWSWSETITVDDIDYFPESQFPSRGMWNINFTSQTNLGLIGSGYGITACFPPGVHGTLQAK